MTKRARKHARPAQWSYPSNRTQLEESIQPEGRLVGLPSVREGFRLRDGRKETRVARTRRNRDLSREAAGIDVENRGSRGVVLGPPRASWAPEPTCSMSARRARHLRAEPTGCADLPSAQPKAADYATSIPPCAAKHFDGHAGSASPLFSSGKGYRKCLKTDNILLVL